MKLLRIKKIILIGASCAALVVAGRFSLYGETAPAPAPQPAKVEVPIQKEEPAKQTGEIEAVGLEKFIFLDLRDINVIDILKFLAIEGDLNIVTSKNVQGRSTLLLRNVKIQDALDIIVLSNQLAYNLKNDIIYVMTEQEYLSLYGKPFSDQKRIKTRILTYAKPSYVLTALQSIQSSLGKVIIDEETGSVIMIDTAEKLEQMDSLLDKLETKVETKAITLQYAVAKDLETQLKTKLDSKSVGSVTADERSNQIVITAYPGRMDDIVKLVKSLDVKTKAVLIDMRILQLTINPKYDSGINWERVFTGSRNKLLQTLSFQNAFPISSSISTDDTIGTVGKIAAGTLTTDEFTFELKMLKQIEKTNTLASPRLMVLNRQEAKINIGDRIPYVITTTTGTGTNVSVSEDIKFIDVGLILVVTPVINDDGFITMKIRPEISSRTGTLTTPTDNAIPIVNTTYLESSIVVKDGVTVILGGLRRDELTENNKGNPFMMKIPVIGNAFRSRAETTRKTEIVIFITPKIVNGSNSMTWADAQLKPTKLDFSPQPTQAQKQV